MIKFLVGFIVILCVLFVLVSFELLGHFLGIPAGLTIFTAPVTIAIIATSFLLGDAVLRE